VTPPTTRIKVTLRLETKAALELVAARHGVSLSELLAAAAEEKYLLTVTKADSLEAVIEQLTRIEEKLGSLNVVSVSSPPDLTQPAEKTSKPRKKRRGPRLGVTGYVEAEPTLNTPKPSVVTSPRQAIDQELPVHIDHLIDRWGGDNALKARLCQLGGRKGHLFKGSLTHAQNVETVTKGLDPEGLPWFPTSQDRDFWVQMDSSTFVKTILIKP
jgi:hypothetical protein